MGSATVNVSVPTLDGMIVEASGTTAYQHSFATAEVATIAAATAQGALDMASLHIRMENQNTITTVAVSLAAGTRYSEIGQGVKTFTIGTAATIMFGGQGFEDARFMNTAGTVVFTLTGTGPTVICASQSPRASE